MTPILRFEDFELDPADRRLRRAGEPVELNGRYFDALALLASEPGRLVSKDRFLDEVWSGVPVTDEALTQCIKTLRRQLGDDAARPRFIETVPKHGYRFIAPVAGANAAPKAAPSEDKKRLIQLGVAGTGGGVLAGFLGGLFYGFAGAAAGVGAISVLLVLLSLTVILAALGAAGVAFGIAAAGLVRRPAWHWTVAGAAFGGVLVGALVKLLGLDALNLLFGSAPGGMTGASEGAILGAAVGVGYVIADRCERLRIGVVLAALCGGAAGLVITLLGGQLMGGSLDLLAQRFPASRLRLDQVGALFGEAGFGPVTTMATSVLEGVLFAGSVVGAMLLARRRGGA